MKIKDQISKRDFEKQIKDWERQAEAHRKLADELEHNSSVARKLLNGLTPKKAVKSGNGTKPSLRQATLALLKKYPDGVLVEKMLSELKSMGYTGGAKSGLKPALYASINKLRKQHNIVTVETVQGSGYKLIEDLFA